MNHVVSSTESEIQADSSIYRFIVRPLPIHDHRSSAYLTDAHAFGLSAIESIACCDLYFVEGQLADSDARQLGTRLLSDPLTETVEWARMDKAGVPIGLPAGEF